MVRMNMAGRLVPAINPTIQQNGFVFNKGIQDQSHIVSMQNQVL